MSRKTSVALYAVSCLLLLACPYAVPKLYRYFHEISSRTFRIMPQIYFDCTAALLLGALLAAHIYFFHKLDLPRKRLAELCLSVLFGLAVPAVYLNIRVIPGLYFQFPAVSCFLFAFTLLTALLFGKKAVTTA